MEAGAVRSARYELTTTHFVSNLMGSVHTMYPCLFLKTHRAKVIAVLLLLLLLTSCGTQNQPTPPSTSLSTSSISSTPTSSLSQSLTLNQTGISIDKAGLHVDVAKGVQCPLDTPTQASPDNLGQTVFELSNTGNNLVLATDRLTYDSNELQQIKDYVSPGKAAAQ